MYNLLGTTATHIIIMVIGGLVFSVCSRAIFLGVVTDDDVLIGIGSCIAFTTTLLTVYLGAYASYLIFVQ